MPKTIAMTSLEEDDSIRGGSSARSHGVQSSSASSETMKTKNISILSQMATKGNGRRPEDQSLTKVYHRKRPEEKYLLVNKINETVQREEK